MSTSSRHATLQRRASAATTQLSEVLSLQDSKVLSAAVVEATLTEVQRNPSFKSRIQRLYDELAVMHNQRPNDKRKRAQPEVHLVPMPGAESTKFDPFAPLNPYHLLTLYGPHQLRDALSVYSPGTLREAVTIVKQKFPGSKPLDARKTDSLLDYIVQHIAPGR